MRPSCHSRPLAAALCLLLLCPTACQKQPRVHAPRTDGSAPAADAASAPAADAATSRSGDAAGRQPAAPQAGFRNEWSPTTGKGRIVQVMEDGNRYELCLQCKYKGYAGGLWVGSMNGSGFLWVPPKPIRGFRSLNLFCAQDESLWDEQDGVEYDAGWSQNFGKGDDGTRLEYVEGEILADGLSGDLALRSVNRAGCWQLTRYLLWPGGMDYIIIATWVKNVCDKERTFSFWTGEDPWIGLYRTAEGDVGWYSGGLVPVERSLPGREFRWGGMYDLGNAVAGEKPGSFSNVADFFQVDPALPPPDRVFFANRFAHDESEIEPGRPLDNKSLTAFNLGWVRMRLPPGREAHFRYAMGRARTREPGALPTIPTIPPEQFRFDEVYHQAAAGDPALGTSPASAPFELPVRFASEVIDLRLEPPQLHVDALYVFRNRTSGAQSSRMFYPFPVDAAHPYPHDIQVEGAKFTPADRGILWQLAMQPHQETSVQVKYSQQCNDRSARYILKSTSNWGQPLEHATYRVRWPASLPNVNVSYSGTLTRDGDHMLLQFERDDFMPPRDLLITWGE